MTALIAIETVVLGLLRGNRTLQVSARLGAAAG